MKAKGFFLGLLALLGGFGGAEGLGDPMAGRLEREAEVLLRLFTEEVREEAFAPGFLAQVPAAQVAAIVAQLKANLGEPEGARPLDGQQCVTGARVEGDRIAGRLDMLGDVRVILQDV